MDSQRFLNACKILIDFDRETLEAVGVISRNPHGDELWKLYLERPIHFLCRLDDHRLDRVCELIRRRQQ